MKIIATGKSVIGGREKNQDAYLINDALHLFAVADGVGGGMQGEVASQMAVSELQARYQPGLSLSDIITKIQHQVLERALQDCGGEALMGTTCTIAQVTGDLLTVCHVGDSRCYLFDGAHLKQLTEDHESYEESVQGSVLNSYLGLDTRVHPLKIYFESFSLQPGNRILLCSDGLYKQVEEMDIVDSIKKYGPDGAGLVDHLVSEAEKAEYSDNITLVYLQCES